MNLSRSNDYTTGTDYLYHHKYHKLIGIDLLRQENTIITQQINFSGKLGEDDGVKMFFLDEKQRKTMLNFSLDSF